MVEHAGAITVPVDVDVRIRRDEERIYLSTRRVWLDDGRCLGTLTRKHCDQPARVVVAGDVAQCIDCGTDTLARQLERALREARQP